MKCYLCGTMDNKKDIEYCDFFERGGKLICEVCITKLYKEYAEKSSLRRLKWLQEEHITTA